jgi:hypothetical protein
MTYSLFILRNIKVKKEKLCNKQRRPTGLSDVKDPHFVYSAGLRMAVRMSALRTGRALLTEPFLYFCLWYSFLLETEETPGHY